MNKDLSTTLSKKESLFLIVKELRVHHWLKNVLIFLPLFSWFEIGEALTLGSFYLSFSLLASATYVLNDLSDLTYDRAHPLKKNRPLASGQLSQSIAVNVSVALLVVSSCISLYLGPRAFLTLSLYLIVTLAYSFKLKKIFILDILTLGFLYSLRSASGFILLSVQAPGAIILFSFFFFLSLATIKRIKEIQGLSKACLEKIRGRGYGIKDLAFLVRFGHVTSLLSVMVLLSFLVEVGLFESTKSTFHLVFFSMLCIWKIRLWRLVKGEVIKEELIRFMLEDYFTLLFVGISIGLLIIRGWL